MGINKVLIILSFVAIVLMLGVSFWSDNLGITGYVSHDIEKIQFNPFYMIAALVLVSVTCCVVRIVLRKYDTQD